MNDYVDVCSHCRHEFRVDAIDDVAFYFHWLDDCFLVDVILRFEGCHVSLVLHRDVYVVANGTK